jgi:hypothetical protein
MATAYPVERGGVGMGGIPGQIQPTPAERVGHAALQPDP